MTAPLDALRDSGCEKIFAKTREGTRDFMAASSEVRDRGDVVTVAATGEYAKPRRAVIVQTDALPAGHASVVICQMTSECNDAPDFRQPLTTKRILYSHSTDFPAVL